jgi:hypothetical protein
LFEVLAKPINPEVLLSAIHQGPATAAGSLAG